MTNDLPKGWANALLREVVVPRSERISPQALPDALFVGMEHVEPHTNQILETVPAGTMASNAARFYAGDVLYGRMRPYLNKVVSPRFDGLASAEFIVFPKSDAIDGRFLLRRISASDFTEFACSQYEGDRPRVKFDQLSAFNILLPPVKEQIRIVEKLEELMSDLDAGVAELKAAQRKLAQYRQSLLKAAVEGALTADWRAARTEQLPRPLAGEGGGGGSPQPEISPQAAPPSQPSSASGGRSKAETGADLLQRILIERRARWEAKQLAKFALQGKTPPKDWQVKYPEPAAPDTIDLPTLPEGWTWASVDQLSPDDLANGRSVPTAIVGAKVLRLTAVKNGRIDLAEFKHGDWSIEEAQQFSVVEGDLLIVRGNGSLALVGRAGLVPEVTGQVAYPDTMIRLRVIDSVVRTRWVAALWDSALVRSHLERRARTSAGIYKISQPDIVTVAIPIPPIAEQDEMLAILDRSSDDTNAIQSTMQLAEKQSAAQRKNILKAAFAGQLVPQDPSDEPASVLLERIRAERAENGTTTARKRGRNHKDSA